MTGDPSPQTMSLEQAFLLARSHFAARRFNEADTICQQILHEHSNQPQTIGLSGLLAAQRGDSDRGIELLRQAIALAPTVASLHDDLAQLLARIGRYQEAIDEFETLSRLLPAAAHIQVNLATLFQRMGKFAQAAEAARRALAINPRNPEAHSALGNILFRQARFDDAAQAYQQAAAIAPKNPAFLNNLASALACTGEVAEAIACYDRALAIKPGLITAESNRIYFMHYLPGCDAAAILKEQKRWARRHATPLAREARPHGNDRSPERRLRIGYVCAEFRDHILGRYLLPLFREHDRQSFEVICYSDVSAADDITREFRLLAGIWRDTLVLSHRDLANQVREDRIDLLVDTMMHMSGSRLPVFAYKPAPVQIAFAAYPSGTGMDAIDYRLTDPYLDPPGEHDDWYVERSIRLPHTFWCYDTSGEQPPVGPLPARSNGYITFGSLNNFAKVNPQVLPLWANVLDQIPNSRLILLAPPGRPRDRVRAFFTTRSISADRIEFVPHQPRLDYLLTYSRIDIVLDTFPYNGHMTSLDALWMGVPVVTFMGQTGVGRAGFSQLSNLGYAKWVADSQAVFMRIAREMAGDLDGLADIRATLRQRMIDSPLTNGRQWAADIDIVFRKAWRNWCEMPR